MPPSPLSDIFFAWWSGKEGRKGKERKSPAEEEEKAGESREGLLLLYHRRRRKRADDDLPLPLPGKKIHHKLWLLNLQKGFRQKRQVSFS